MSYEIDTRSKAVLLLVPLLLASLFPVVQMLTSMAFSLLARTVFDQAAAREITGTAEYLLAVTAVSQILALGVIVRHSRVIRFQPLRPYRRHLNYQALRRSAALAGPVIVLTIGAQMVEGSILSLFEVELGRYAEIAEVILEAHIAVVLVTVALIPGICEEVIFRGIIQPATVRGAGPVLGIAYAAAIFGLVHLIPVQIFAGFFFGIVFGYLTYRSGSVRPAIVSHITANAIVALVGHVASDAQVTPGEVAAEAASAGMLLTTLAAGAAVATAGIVWFESRVRGMGLRA